MKRWLLATMLAFSMTALAQERAIVKEIVVKAKPEEVWQAWTTSEGIKSFFAPGARIEARPDGPFEVYINPFAPAGLRGADDMRVLAVQEPRLISFTWNAPPSLAEVRKQRTVVTVRLFPAENGMTRVVLHHSGWGDGGQWDQTYNYFNNAWTGVLGNLKKRYDEGPVDWTEWLARMKASTEAPKDGAPASK